MKKIICIGSACKDIFFPTTDGKIIETPEEIDSQKKIAFELGAKYKINERFESLGGCSANVAAGLSRQGISVLHYTTIGKDAIGKWIIQKHKEEKIGTKLIEICGCKSDLSMILIDEKSGDRVIFHNKESNEKFKFNAKKITGFDWIYIGDIFGDWKKIIFEIIEEAKKENISIAFNPRQTMIAGGKKDELFEAFKSCNVVFLNKDEAIEILMTGDGQLVSQKEEDLLFELRKKAPAIFVITDGERGAWADDGKEFVHVEAIKVEKVVDMTGAGDAFASGFLAAYLKDKALEECVLWGIKNGTSVVKHYGGIEGLLKEGEIEK